MSEHPIEGLMTTAMDSIRNMIDVNTIIGEPIETIIVPYDKMMKCCNIKSFLSFDYRLRWVKSLSFFTS